MNRKGIVTILSIVVPLFSLLLVGCVPAEEPAAEPAAIDLLPSTMGNRIDFHDRLYEAANAATNRIELAAPEPGGVAMAERLIFHDHLWEKRSSLETAGEQLSDLARSGVSLADGIRFHDRQWEAKTMTGEDSGTAAAAAHRFHDSLWEQQR